MPKRTPKSEPGHKERFDALFAAMVPPKASKATAVQVFDITPNTSLTIAPGGLSVSSTTTQEQIDAYMRAVEDGTYCGL